MIVTVRDRYNPFNSHAYKVDPYMTIGQLKQKIKDDKEIGLSKQPFSLRFEGKYLKQDDETLKELGIVDGSKVLFSLIEKPKPENDTESSSWFERFKIMKVCIMNYINGGSDGNDKFTLYTIEPGMTLVQLKKMVEGNTGIPSGDQCFNFRGEDLIYDKKKTLEELGIIDKSVIFLLPKPKVGSKFDKYPFHKKNDDNYDDLPPLLEDPYRDMPGLVQKK